MLFFDLLLRRLPFITIALLYMPSSLCAPPRQAAGVSENVVLEFQKRNGLVFDEWQKPELLLVITGQLDGYIEPCGCSGKENQKGGLSRRQNFLRAVASAQWPFLSIDLGNQVKRFGRQTEIKFQSIADGLRQMGYAAVGFGPGDLRLPAEELVAAVAPVGDQPTPFVSANVGLLGLDANITPRFRVIESNGVVVGFTTVLGEEEASRVHNDAIEVLPARDALKPVVKELSSANCTHQVLLSWASPEETKQLAKQFPQFDIVVTAGGADEPAATLPTLPSKAQFVELGHKGMYAVAIGFFEDSSVRSQRVPLDARWGESSDMIKLLAGYQSQLESLKLEGLGLRAIRHPSGHRFAGSDACADCHEDAYNIWKETPHASALVTLEEQDPRRDSDPECLSCHVVGWAPQRFEPFEGGFLSMESTAHLAHQGCENCHGPAAAHAAVELGDVRADAAEQERLRNELSMTLDTDEGRKKVIANCLECHDLDNSPDFDFDEYWPAVEHSGY